MSFTFEPIEKNQTGRYATEKTLHLGKKSIHISPDIARYWSQTRYKRPSTVGDGVLLKIEVDPVNQAIKLTESVDGFSGIIWESGAATLTVPSRMRSSGMPLGDYVLVEGHSNVFQLAR